MLLVGLFFAWTASAEFRADLWLQVMGQETTGQVTELRQESCSCGKYRRFPCTRFLISFNFLAAGAVHAAQDNVSPEFWVSTEFWQALVKGDRVSLRYLETDPGLNQIEAGLRFWPQYDAILFGMSFMAIGGYLFSRNLRRAHRLVYLRENGTRRKARVARQVPTAVWINRHSLWQIEWQDAGGKVGKSRAQYQSGLPGLGAEIWIYADPAGKLASVWEGDCGRCREDSDEDWPDRFRAHIGSRFFCKSHQVRRVEGALAKGVSEAAWPKPAPLCRSHRPIQPSGKVDQAFGGFHPRQRADLIYRKQPLPAALQEFAIVQGS